MTRHIVAAEGPTPRVACKPGPRYGEFSDEALRDVFRELEAWLGANDLKPSRWITYFHDNPETEPEAGGSEACVSFVGDAPPPEDMEVREVPPVTVARYRTHLDRVEDPDPVYRNMYAWVSASRYRPTGEWFVREIDSRDPWDAEPSDVEVEFQAPVREVE